uniref:Uncharacterized protein n=1 Tax=Arundo donax TaxID=35708 RepID=A0A0A9GVC6_ARUDO
MQYHFYLHLPLPLSKKTLVK